MRRFVLTAICGVACCSIGMAASPVATKRPAGERDLAKTAAEVIERNVAARGGLEAWRNVDTMVWLGHLEHGGRETQHIPFVMTLKRPTLTRSPLRLRSGHRGATIATRPLSISVSHPESVRVGP